MAAIQKLITTMTTADNLAPIVALEGVVVAGRTREAHQRGGKEERRERIIEELSGSIVWLWGVKFFNDIGDFILGKVLKTNGVKFDVGTDKVLRTPFDNFMKKGVAKGITARKVALLKAGKVLTSILLANLIMGFLVPKLNHYITNKMRAQSEMHNQNSVKNSDDKFVKSEKTENIENKENDAQNVSNNPTFKGGMAGINVFTNAIENTNTGKLLSCDFGVAGGRMYNARTKEERREIAIRDIGSIYFYMWAQGHVINLLNLAENGKCGRLDPNTAETLNKYLIEFIKEHNGELTAEEFRKYVLGKDISEIKLPEGIKFERGELSFFDKLSNKYKKVPVEPLQVAKVSDLEQIVKCPEILNRIKEMSKLQPERMGESVITKAQIIDALNKSVINDPKLLDEVFDKFTGGASKSEFQYVSEKKLRNLKGLMESYVDDLCKQAKDGKITEATLNKFKNKNLTISGINFAIGFGVAGLFLATLIPKFQYFVTKKTTGIDAFPGTYDYGNRDNVKK